MISDSKPEDLDAMDLNTMKDEEIQEAVWKRLLGAMTNNGNTRK